MHVQGIQDFLEIKTPKFGQQILLLWKSVTVLQALLTSFTE